MNSEKEVKKVIEFQLALEKVLKEASYLGMEEVPTLSAQGRVLAMEIKAQENIPPFNKATMDGFAVRMRDTLGASPTNPVILRIVGDLKAGKLSSKALRAKEAIRVMTGAPLPKGAEAVVKVEDTKCEGKKLIIYSQPKFGENIGRAGEDVKKGEVVLEKGIVIGPAELGMIAACGYKNVKVSKKPKVAIFSTGDELVEPGMTLRAGKIRDANGYSLSGLVRQAGAEPKFFGIIKDRKGELKKKLVKAKKFDVIVLSGGVSIGTYDLIKEELEKSGVKKVFWEVKIKPGKPVYFGIKGKQLIFGLPGNPVSAMVCFLLFVRPALDIMAGKKRIGLLRGKGIMDEDFTVKPGRRQFLRAIVDRDSAIVRVKPYPEQKSGVLRSMVESNVLIDIPSELEILERGEEVDIIYMDS